MSDYDYLDDQPQPSGSTSGVIFNVLTVLVLIMVLCIAAGFLAIFINPNSALNPFPPPTLPAALAFPTGTPTPRSVLPPTWTPSPSPEPTRTFTPEPTTTPFPTETPFPLFTETSAPPVGGMPFVVGAGTPIGTSSAPFHPEAGCNWLGVAGQVFDLSSAPISGQQIHLGGELAGTPVDMLSLTGLAGSYGSPGFYEFVIGDTPVSTKSTLWIQLQDQAGLPMSEKIYFDTYDNCEKNLVFINFQQVR